MINAGDDFLKTLPGSFVDIGFGPIDLTGNGNTVVRRLQDAECPMSGVGGACEVIGSPGDTTIDIELVALSLVSVNPIDFGGTLYDLRIDKNPIQTTLGSEMAITINDAGTGGMFSSLLNVDALLTFTEVGNSNNIVVDSFFDVFVSLDIPWSTQCPPSYPDCSSNFYPGVLPGTTKRVAFDEQAALARHRVTATPEPATLALMALGLIGIAYWRKVRV